MPTPYGSTSRESAARGGAKKSPRDRHPECVNPATSEPDYSPECVEFLREVDAWKGRTGKRFPSNSELFGLLLRLGYRKAEPPES